MPGVPPDALNNLKRAFKGIFRRGKKTNADSQPASNYGSAAPDASSAVAPPPTSASLAEAPQLPPIQNTSGSPFDASTNSATDPSKPPPPTHLLSTSTHDQPPVAVPVDQDAQPGLPAPPTTAPAAATEDVKDEQLAPGGVSPPEQGSTLDGATSGAVSAVEESSQTEEPVKTDSGIEQPKVDGAAGEGNDVTTDVATPPTKENVPPVMTTTTTEGEQAPATNGTLPTTADSQAPIDPVSEEKVAVTMEEPPPIRSVATAPGMSATSGPLEEFPEGGYVRENEH